MKSNINKTFAVILAVMVFMPAFTFAEPTVTGGANAGVTTPSVTNQGSAAVTAQTPATTNQGSASVVASTPVVTNQGSAAVIASTPVVTNQGSASVVASTPVVTNQGSAAVTVSTPTVTNQGSASETSNTPAVTNQGSAAVTGTPASNPSTPELEKNPGSSSGSRGGGSRNRTTPVVATTLPILAAINTSDCPYLNSYMRFGVENDKTDVTKLQIFLKNSEGLNVDINGIFDQKTLDAVIVFQAKYVEETMAPWGVTTPSGQVFYTTKNKINELVCKTPIKLTAEQLAFIEAYKTGQTDAATTGTTNIDGSVGTSTEVGSADAPLKAAVGTSSIFGKIWGFIKWLFGY